MSRLVTIISYEWQPLLAIAVEWRASSLNSLKAMVTLYTLQFFKLLFAQYSTFVSTVPYGPYFEHVLGYWKQHRSDSNDNLLWITYEEMHRDPEGSIRRVAEFLDHPLTDAQVG